MDNKPLQAFYFIKDILAQTTLLSHPKADAPICILTDASDVAVELSYNSMSIMSGNLFLISQGNLNLLRQGTVPSTENHYQYILPQNTFFIL